MQHMHPLLKHQSTYKSKQMDISCSIIHFPQSPTPTCSRKARRDLYEVYQQIIIVLYNCKPHLQPNNNKGKREASDSLHHIDIFHFQEASRVSTCSIHIIQNDARSTKSLCYRLLTDAMANSCCWVLEYAPLV